MRRIVSGHSPTPTSSAPDEDDDDLPREVLVVVSKLKSYVRARSSMNTSDGVVDVLSDHLRALCRAAIRSAAANSRKTVLARDFEAVLKGQSAASE
jgi:histone H3/H4